MTTIPLLSLVLLLGPSPQEAEILRSEVRRLEARVALLSAAVRERDELLDTVREQLGAVREEVHDLREHPPRSMAAAFLAGPPNASDRLGVAGGAVFAPRLEVDSALRHDTVYVRLKRVESSSVRTIAELELTPDLNGIDLPVDDSGALYLAEWLTTEGHVYNLVLRDGASGQPAASVPVTERLAEGRFAFVGLRLE